jgi:hypothetical protein
MGLEFEEITEGIAVFVEMKDVAARACDLTLTCFHYCLAGEIHALLMLFWNKSYTKFILLL